MDFNAFPGFDFKDLVGEDKANELTIIVMSNSV
jgi:hypothetical protein